jgi:hypothetical protein
LSALCLSRASSCFQENARLVRVELKDRTSHNVREFELNKLLENTFPFDPYLLPISKP